MQNSSSPDDAPATRRLARADEIAIDHIDGQPASRIGCGIGDDARALPVWGCPSRPSSREAPGRCVGQGGAPAAKRGRTTLTNTRAGAGFLWAGRWRRGGSLRYLGARRTTCRRRQQSGSGVPRKRRARSRQCYMAVHLARRRARAWREQTAVATRDVRLGDRDRRDQRCSGRHCVDDVGVEVAQDVIAAPSELARHRKCCDLAVVTCFHGRVVVVVGTAGP